MMVKEFKKRRDFFVDGLNSIEGVSCFNPKGAFYVFPSFKGLAGRTYKGRKVTSIAQWTEISAGGFSCCRRARRRVRQGRVSAPFFRHVYGGDRKRTRKDKESGRIARLGT